MQGDHPRRKQAEPGKRYAMLIDVAGEEEHGSSSEAIEYSGRRDSTAVTVVEIDTGTTRKPIYRVVDRLSWLGTKHRSLHDQLVHLARDVWKAERVVIDGTGIGAGLASFLADSLGDRSTGKVIPVDKFIFSLPSKSQLAWLFLGLIESGRYKEYADDASVSMVDRNLTARFHAELKGIAYTIREGPGQQVSWGALPGRGHDDLVMSAALVAELEGVEWKRRIAKGS